MEMIGFAVPYNTAKLEGGVHPEGFVAYYQQIHKILITNVTWMHRIGWNQLIFFMQSRTVLFATSTLFYVTNIL